MTALATAPQSFWESELDPVSGLMSRYFRKDEA